MDLLIVTGMSGAGKTKTINTLEDMGYFCADNVPPILIKKFLDLYLKYDSEESKIALVVDVRGGKLFADIEVVLNNLTAENIHYKLLFLDADEDILLKRYKESRRRHPLLTDNTQLLEDVILQEKEMLATLKKRADFVVDTTNTPPQQLKARITELFTGKKAEKQMYIQCLSFGFKNGLPPEADLVIDVRCLVNPFYELELREHTGLEDEVRDYVLKNDETKEFLNRLYNFIDYSIPMYANDGKSQLVIAIGCTGGKHRSVVVAEELKTHLVNNSLNAGVSHRDIKKPNHI